MPILKNAIKKMRQDAKRTKHNKDKKSTMKTVLKKAKLNLSNESLSAAFSKIDKAAKTHLIHKNKAARIKSRLAKALNKVAAVAQPKKVTKKATRTTKKEAPAA